MRLIAPGVVAAICALVLAAPAGAAPVAEGTVSAASPTFQWTGTAYGTNLAGEPCNTDHSCEDALVKVEAPGTLSVAWTATAAAGGPAWLSVSVLKSDAGGAEGDMIADGGGLEDQGAVAARLDEGYYLVRVAGLLTTLASYDATATLKPRIVAAPAPVPPAAAPTEPVAKKKKSCKKKKTKKARKRCKRKRKRKA